MNGINYKQPTVPEEYKCGKCGVTGVKLWRQYQTSNPKLLCAECAAADQKKDISNIDASGEYTSELGRQTDQIDWYVPAVPDEESIGYWGYCRVPDVGIQWWKNLPTKKSKLDI